MYLKRIEAKGFKSFADRTNLDFGKGITAIVGPNGSGKSNISDAVRWVLGEQSAKTLRGGKMEDIIFVGTQSRKQLGCAQVDLTIDNSDNILPVDFSEVTISRRLYRSGESEYLFNNTPCRLKDIVELFMDTGIGKEGYSIIGQGKIEEILSTRSEDRRNLFEEAAGIVKYKWRKEEAQKKLENTNANLQRIEDIIWELQDQIEPLREQSEVAKKYLKLKEELKKLEINLTLHNYEATEKKLQDIQRNISELTGNKDIYEKRKDSLNNEYKATKQTLYKIEENIKKASNDRFECEKNHENKSGDLRLLNEKIENLNKEKNRLEEEINSLEGKLDKIRIEYNDFLSSSEILRGEIEIQDTNINELEKDYENINIKFNETEDIINSKKSEIIQILNDISEFKNKINIFNVNLDNLKNRQSQLLREIDIKNDKKTSFYSELNELEEKIKSIDIKICEINSHIENLNNNKVLLEQNEVNLLKERNTTFDKLKTSEARFHTLNLLQNDMEGFNKAVKSIIKNFKDNKKVYGTISDIIEVPKGYEVAIEIALTSSIQNIVVDNEDTAQEIINFLKINNLGRATFLPLTTIKPREMNFKIENDFNGYLGIASNLVKFDVKFKNAILNLLGRILICDNLDNAKKLARKVDYSFRIVTLDGEVINSGGSFTGGSTNLKKSGILSRKNEINDLSEIIKINKNYLQNIENKIKNNKDEINKNKFEIEDSKKILNEFMIEIETNRNKLQGINKSIGELQENINDNSIEIQQILNDIGNNEKLIEINLKDLDKLKFVQSQEESNLERLQNEYKAIQLEKEKLIDSITKKKVIRAEKSKMLETINEKINSLEAQSKEYKFLIDESKNSIEECIRNITSIKSNLAETELKIKDEIIKIQNLNKYIENQEASKKELQLKYSSMEKNILACDDSFNSIVNSIHKLEISKTKLEGEISNSANRLWDEYELSIPEAYAFKEDINNISNTSRIVNELKESIKELGNVNVNSIEDYKRVVEKYDFLNNQKNDLITAQASLMEIINEIINKMRAQFEEGFKIIKENFNTTFKQLFGGGNADLKIDGEDVLSAGIEIIVQPPGKKLQTISLLSGGEKGLAAIALIFAILKMKPTPFCVLDEIEAALDDANVNRFAQFLKVYSDSTQFIVITHRKGSMAAADTLYGVTMEEKGVSKIISLKLKGGI